MNEQHVQSGRSKNITVHASRGFGSTFRQKKSQQSFETALTEPMERFSGTFITLLLALESMLDQQVRLLNND